MGGSGGHGHSHAAVSSTDPKPDKKDSAKKKIESVTSIYKTIIESVLPYELSRRLC